VESDEEDGVSFRMVLPSESHRKLSKGRLRSAGDSVSSLATSHGDLSGVCCVTVRGVCCVAIRGVFCDCQWYVCCVTVNVCCLPVRECVM